MADATTSQTGFWLTDALSTLTNGAAGYLNNRLTVESQLDELQLYRQQQIALAQYPQQPATVQQAAAQNFMPVILIGLAVLAVVLVAKH